jgi:hypothetical protein
LSDLILSQFPQKQDIRYLQPIVEEVTAEFAEREAFDNAKVLPRK